MNGYNFTERVRKVLALSREEAARLNHEYVGTEHILLGLLREGEGVGAEVLRKLAGDLETLADRIEKVVQPGRSQPPGPDLPYTSRAKKVLEGAMSAASELGHRYVGTEHLVLGLLRERNGIAAQVLVAAGVTLESARSEVMRILGTEGPPVPSLPRDQRRVVEPTGSALDHVEVILHYRDGRRVQSSFVSTRDAVGFLDRADRGR